MTPGEDKSEICLCRQVASPLPLFLWWAETRDHSVPQEGFFRERPLLLGFHFRGTVKHRWRCAPLIHCSKQHAGFRTREAWADDCPGKARQEGASAGPCIQGHAWILGASRPSMMRPESFHCSTSLMPGSCGCRLVTFWAVLASQMLTMCLSALITFKPEPPAHARSCQ